MLDYDLVIIGDTSTAIQAALAATTFPARVALVQSETVGFASPSGLNAIHGLSQVGECLQQLHRAPQFGISSSGGDLELNLHEAIHWINGVVANLEEQNASTILTSLGIDVITGTGHFVNKPHLAFLVNGRHLRGLRYLLAPGTQPRVPEIDGLTDMNYLTSRSLAQWFTSVTSEENDWHQLPQRWVIIGGNPAGIEFAQTLVRLGKSVTLVLRQSHLLSQEEPEAAFLIQNCLEAEGVRVLTNTSVMQAKMIQGQKWIQVGNEAIETDEIFLATGEVPQVDSLNLEAVGVQNNGQRLQLNSKLQTTNSRIYACGDVAGGYPFPHIAAYEAKVAVKNALLSPIYPADYSTIPWAIFADPQLARVGLTEAQARRRYGEKVQVYQHHFKTLDKAVITDEILGFCKLITDEKDKILGATVVGAQATELISTIALAMNHKISLEKLAQQCQISPSFTEIIGQTVAGEPKHHPWYNLLDNLFHWRRYWFS